MLLLLNTNFLVLELKSLQTELFNVEKSFFETSALDENETIMESNTVDIDDATQLFIEDVIDRISEDLWLDIHQHKAQPVVEKKSLSELITVKQAQLHFKSKSRPEFRPSTASTRLLPFYIRPPEKKNAKKQVRPRRPILFQRPVTADTDEFGRVVSSKTGRKIPLIHGWNH